MDPFLENWERQTHSEWYRALQKLSDVDGAAANTLTLAATGKHGDNNNNSNIHRSNDINISSGMGGESDSKIVDNGNLAVRERSEEVNRWNIFASARQASLPVTESESEPQNTLTTTGTIAAASRSATGALSSLNPVFIATHAGAINGTSPQQFSRAPHGALCRDACDAADAVVASSIASASTAAGEGSSAGPQHIFGRIGDPQQQNRLQLERASANAERDGDKSSEAVTEVSRSSAGYEDVLLGIGFKRLADCSCKANRDDFCDCDAGGISGDCFGDEEASPMTSYPASSASTSRAPSPFKRATQEEEEGRLFAFGTTPNNISSFHDRYSSAGGRFDRQLTFNPFYYNNSRRSGGSGAEEDAGATCTGGGGATSAAAAAAAASENGIRLGGSGISSSSAKRVVENRRNLRENISYTSICADSYTRDENANRTSTTGRKKASEQARGILFDWLNDHRDHPYPSKAQKIELASKTGMTVAQVVHWMSNVRKRRVIPLLNDRREPRSNIDRKFLDEMESRKSQGFKEYSNDYSS